MLVVQDNSFNRSKIETIVCVALTSQIKWAKAPGNVTLPTRATGLERDSVANVSQIVTLDRSALTERVGQLSQVQFARVVDGICLVLGRVEIGNQ